MKQKWNRSSTLNQFLKSRLDYEGFAYLWNITDAARSSRNAFLSLRNEIDFVYSLTSSPFLVMIGVVDDLEAHSM